MKVIIFTDGSMKHGVCGWAAHISYDGNSHLLSGKSPIFIKSSSQSETYAVLKAIQAVKALEPSVSQIEVFTDLLGLKNRLAVNGKRTKNVVSKTLQDKIVSEAQGSGIGLSVNFVKGHQKKNSGKDAELNYLVDLHARAKRKEFQKELEQKQPSKVGSFFEFISFKYNLNLYTSFPRIGLFL